MFQVEEKCRDTLTKPINRGALWVPPAPGIIPRPTCQGEDKREMVKIDSGFEAFGKMTSTSGNPILVTLGATRRWKIGLIKISDPFVSRWRKVSTHKPPLENGRRRSKNKESKSF